MNTININITIPQGTQRKKTKQVLEKIAELLEEGMNNIDFEATGTQTHADVLGVSDTVWTLTAGEHLVEVTV
jgi:hypothetical protein